MVSRNRLRKNNTKGGGQNSEFYFTGLDDSRVKCEQRGLQVPRLSENFCFQERIRFTFYKAMTVTT